MSGLNKYDEKLKREQRRRNHIAKDLASAKYRQRVIPRKYDDDADMCQEELDRIG